MESFYMGVIPFECFLLVLVRVFYMRMKTFPYDPPPYYIIERAKGEGASYLKMCCRHYAAEYTLFWRRNIRPLRPS